MKILLEKYGISTISIFAFAFVVALLRLAFIHYGPIDLAPDEAHYWEFSRTLDWSYYSKPPLVAWLIALSTSVFGDTVLGVRFFAVLGMAVISVLSYLIVRDWRGEKAGWFAFILLLVTPEFAAGGLMMTPDIPCLTFWAASLYMLTLIKWEAPDTERHGRMMRFILLGIFIGLAGLAKYTAALFFPLLALYLVIDRERTKWLMKREIYIAGVVALLMTTPVLYWNAINEFIGLKHVLGQAGGASDTNPLKTIENFLGGQLGVVGPIIFLMLLWVWVKPYFKQHKTGMILWAFSAPLFFAFLVKAFDAKVQPNWPVLAIFGGLLLLAGWVSEQRKRTRILFTVGLVLSAMITVVAHDTFILRKMGVEFPIKRDPLKPVYGWKIIGHAASAVRERITGDTVVLTSRYQTASEMAFYMKGQPEVLYVNPGYRRQNQYDYWSWPKDLDKKVFIYIRENGEIEPQIINAFASCMPMEKVLAERDGVALRYVSIYACAGYQGLERIKSKTF